MLRPYSIHVFFGWEINEVAVKSPLHVRVEWLRSLSIQRDLSLLLLLPHRGLDGAKHFGGQANPTYGAGRVVLI